jgi:hypothetical protein
MTVKLTQIYQNTTQLQKPLDQIPSKLKAPQKIGDSWARIMSCSNSQDKSIQSLLGRLGVFQADTKAQEVLLPLMKECCAPGVEITPCEETTGVYFFSKQGRKFAVFKVGEKRAQTELLVRKVAHKIGLEEHAIPGIFCTLANPKFPKEEIITELWNGKEKHFESDNCSKGQSYNQEVRDENFGVEEPYTLTGILEPFISPPEKEITVREMARMTALAILLGFRDAKSDGMAGAVFFDVEDCMPLRLLPSPSQSPDNRVASLHLPYLESALANEPISRETLEELAQILNKDGLDKELATELRREKISFADLDSEAVVPADWDHGNCPVKIENSINIMESHPTIDLKKTDRMLSEKQLLAFQQRFNRLRDFLNSCVEAESCPTPLDMVCNVDEMYQSHLNLLLSQKSMISPPELIGILSPRKMDEIIGSRHARSLSAHSISVISPSSQESDDSESVFGDQFKPIEQDSTRRTCFDFLQTGAADRR